MLILGRNLKGSTRRWVEHMVQVFLEGFQSAGRRARVRTEAWVSDLGGLVLSVLRRVTEATSTSGAVNEDSALGGRYYELCDSVRLPPDGVAPKARYVPLSQAQAGMRKP